MEGRDARVAGLGDEYELAERECESRGRGEGVDEREELAKKKNKSERFLAFFLSRRRALLPQFLPPLGADKSKVKNVECPIRRESLQHCEE
jgi:hypothetical protein